MAYTVDIEIYSAPSAPAPSLRLTNIPWYAGMTALDAMILGESMNAAKFEFGVQYRSIYGAFVDSIDGVTDGDIANCFWTLWIDGVESATGVSEAIIMETPSKQSALIEWKFEEVSGTSQAISPKTAALP